jgi:hypothetical protein
MFKSIRIALASGMLCFLGSGIAPARPLLMREAPTVGRFNFEAEVSISQRNDQFGVTNHKYKTVVFPVSFRFGATENFDFGFSLKHLSHSMYKGEAKFSGSNNPIVSPEFKWGLGDYFSVLAIWHAAKSEKSGQEMPVVQGDDYEFDALLTFPTRWPLSLSAGYVLKGNYHSTMGVLFVPKKKVEPGDIFQSHGALEIPLAWDFYLLSELAYYYVQERKIDDVPMSHSEGEALDAAVGITWAYKDWNIGTAAAFGLLDEQHTSFDLERGAGDITYKLTIAYKLTRKRLRR